MKKKSIFWILLDLVFLAVFNTVFFVLGGSAHPASVWISYGFIHLSYLMIIATSLLVRKSSSQAVFGFSLYSVSAAYFFAEFIVGLAFIFAGSESYKTALLIQVIIAGIYAVILLSNLLANEHTADSVERREVEVEYIKNVASRVKILADKATDKKANREIEKAYDVLSSSPSRTLAAAKSLEEEIKYKITELEKAVAADETAAIIAIADEIVALTKERNRIIKLSQ